MAAEGDVAGEGEEDFETGMRQNAMERDTADADQDGKLDFGEFCAFVRDREEGEFTNAELKERFQALDEAAKRRARAGGALLAPPSGLHIHIRELVPYSIHLIHFIYFIYF